MLSAAALLILGSEFGCWSGIMQGQVMGETDIDSLIKKFDKDGNSLFDKAGCRLHAVSCGVCGVTLHLIRAWFVPCM